MAEWINSKGIIWATCGSLVLFASTFFLTGTGRNKLGLAPPPQPPPANNSPLKAALNPTSPSIKLGRTGDSTFWLSAEGAKVGPDGSPIPRLVFSCSQAEPRAWLEVDVPTAGFDDDPMYGIPVLLRFDAREKFRLAHPLRDQGGKRFRFLSPVFLINLLDREETVYLDYPPPTGGSKVISLTFRPRGLARALQAALGGCWPVELGPNLSAIPGSQDYPVFPTSDPSILSQSPNDQRIQPMEKVLPLKLIHKEPVQYHPQATGPSKAVRVVCELIVNEEGSVQDARVIKSGDPAFNDAALEAVRKYRYSSPVTEGGEIVKVFWLQTVTFEAH